MTLDQAIQDMLLNSTHGDLEQLATLCPDKKRQIKRCYQAAYGWTIEECEEFLDNASLAFELLVKGVAA